MKKLLLLFSGIVLIGCSSPKLTEEQFTNEYLKKIAKEYPKVNYKVKEPLTIIAKIGNEELLHYLDNSYKEYNLDPENLDEILKRYISSSADLYQKNQEIDIHKIIPIIKPSSYFDEIKQSGIEADDFVWEDYNEDLIIMYGEDEEKNISYFSKEEFLKLNIEKDTLLSFAISNLRNLIPDIRKVGELGNYGLSAGGDYEASLILFKNLWTKDNFDVDGDITISIPNKDLVFITGSNNEAYIKKLKETTNEHYTTGNHPISNSIYRWNGNKFAKMKP